jgi:hypothetical protein
VNKTKTAVRAVHIPSGKSAVARDERSQWTNKKITLERLAALLEDEQEEREQKNRSGLRLRPDKPYAYGGNHSGRFFQGGYGKNGIPGQYA